MVFFKIRRQKGLWIAWSKRLEYTFCIIDVQEFHLWKAGGSLDIQKELCVTVSYISNENVDLFAN